MRVRLCEPTARLLRDARALRHHVLAWVGVGEEPQNLGGFQRLLGFQPNTRAAVLVFGLFHGFGLATKLQEYTLSQNGLVTNIVSFNVGVEIGQVLALSMVLIALGYWRTTTGFLRHAWLMNSALMSAGFVFMGYQLAGFLVGNR